VEAGEEDWTQIREDLGSGMAWIRFNESLSYEQSTIIGTTVRYYLITANIGFFDWLLEKETFDPGQLSLVDASFSELGAYGQQPVLCITTP
jgi:hypothetical protein